MSNFISFDYGTKSIGYAVGQKITCTSKPLGAIKVKNNEIPWDNIKKIIQEWKPLLLVIGMPLNMDGTEQPLSSRVRWFAKELKKLTNLDVILVDERLTTTIAREIIFQQKSYKNLKKDLIDATSATIILNYYLEYEEIYEFI